MACIFPTVKLRPCLVNGQRGLFHCWYSISEIVEPSLMRGGHSGGVISGIMGLVEYEDGTMHKIYPGNIQFLDNLFMDYDFSPREKESN